MDLRTSDGRNELGTRIQSAVAESGYRSLPAFAEALGCSRALIYQYVGGTVLVQLDRLQQIAELTGKSLEWFLADRSKRDEVSRLRGEIAEGESRERELSQQLANERLNRAHDADRGRDELTGVLRELSLAYRKLGDTSSLLATASRWIEAARAAGDQRAMMDATLQVGHAWYHRSDLDHARRCFEDVLRMAEKLGDEAAGLSARQELIRVLQGSGRSAEAREQAVLLTQSPTWWYHWSGLVSQAAIEEQTGNLDQAEAHLQAADTVARDPEQAPERRAVALAYIASNRANIVLARGHYRQALQCVDEMRGLSGQANLTDQLREADLNAVVATMRTGDLVQADEQLDRLEQWADMAQDRRAAALVQVFRSERCRRCGDTMAAKRHARQAIETATSARQAHALAEAELALGLAHLDEGQPDDAQYHLRRSLKRAQNLEFGRLAACARLALATVAVQTGEAGVADELRGIVEVAEASGYADLRANALCALSRVATRRGNRGVGRDVQQECRAIGYLWGEINAILAEAQAAVVSDESDDAAQLLHEAISLRRMACGGSGEPTLSAAEQSVAEMIADAYMTQGRGQDAAALGQTLGSDGLSVPSAATSGRST